MRREKLLAARSIKGWTLAEAAEQIGVDLNTLLRWEKGLSQPHPYNVGRICKVYGATAVDLELQRESVKERLPLSISLLEEPRMEDHDPALAQFLEEDLTLRLLRIVLLWPRRNTHYPELQQFIMCAIGEYDTMNQDKQYSVGRREALRRLALLPIELCGLSALYPVLRQPVEEILLQCTAGTTACWYLRKGKELKLASSIVASYMPTLKAIVQTGSEAQRKDASDLLVQCLLLQSTLVRHVEGRNEALAYVQQAEMYSRTNNNSLLQILALRTMAATYYYAEQWEQALHTAEKAKYLLERPTNVSIPRLVHSYVYAGLATYQARNGQENQALKSLQDAHITFFSQTAQEQTPIWVDHHEANLYLNDGMTKYYLGHQTGALASFAKIDALENKNELIRVETLIDGVMAEVYREDKPRDMDWCIDRWTTGIQDAKELQSEQRFNEALKAYTAMRGAWPTEKCIKDLRELTMHW